MSLQNVLHIETQKTSISWKPVREYNILYVHVLSYSLIMIPMAIITHIIFVKAEGLIITECSVRLPKQACFGSVALPAFQPSPRKVVPDYKLFGNCFTFNPYGLQRITPLCVQHLSWWPSIFSTPAAFSAIAALSSWIFCGVRYQLTCTEKILWKPTLRLGNSFLLLSE